MRIVFAGTPAFALPAIKALNDSSHIVTAVLTQPDRPAGRGRKLQPSPIKQYAIDNAIPVYQYDNLRDKNREDVIRILSDDVDVMVVVAYGLIIPEQILSVPRLGCINIHPSKLPLWRGASPIQHTILSGAASTAVTLIQMEAGMDSGPILSQVECSVQPNESSAQLHDRLSEVGAKQMLTLLSDFESKTVIPIPQEHTHATYTKKIQKADARIDWAMPAATIVNQVRAFNSWPVAFTHLHGERMRIWQAQVIDCLVEHPPGLVIGFSSVGLDIATGEGVLRITEAQLPGMKKTDMKDFYNGQRDRIEKGETVLTN